MRIILLNAFYLTFHMESKATFVTPPCMNVDGILSGRTLYAYRGISSALPGVSYLHWPIATETSHHLLFRRERGEGAGGGSSQTLLLPLPPPYPNFLLLPFRCPYYLQAPVPANLTMCTLARSGY